jgi:hypothetical protein
MEDGQPYDNRQTGQNIAHKDIKVGAGRGPNENEGATYIHDSITLVNTYLQLGRPQNPTYIAHIQLVVS